MLRKVLQSLDDLQRKSQKKNRSRVEEYASISGVDTLLPLMDLEAFVSAHMDVLRSEY